MTETAPERAFYRPICSSSEIDRVLNVANGSDYLLRLRADTIVDNMRLFRVYRNKALAAEPNWSLEGSFDSSHYKMFLSTLPASLRGRCEGVVFGDIFSTDPNGYIIETEYGPVVTVSVALRYFLRFAHLALMWTPTDVPTHVRVNGLRIAIRIMLGTETLDFLMDPRGILPHDVRSIIDYPIRYQLSFVAGHEFCHHLLGHLEVARAIPMVAATPNGSLDYGEERVFTVPQTQELDADLECARYLSRGNRPQEVLLAILIWFHCLELYETARDLMYPHPWKYASHPRAQERYENVMRSSTVELDPQVLRDFRESAEWLKGFLVEDINSQLEVYEVYGSLYLDAPNTEWRGRELIDRVDFY